MNDTANKLTLRKFAAVCRPLWSSPKRLQLLALFATVVALLFIVTQTTVYSVRCCSEVIESLSRGSEPRFVNWMWRSIASVCILAPLIVTFESLRTFLGMRIQWCLSIFCYVRYLKVF